MKLKIKIGAGDFKRLEGDIRSTSGRFASVVHEELKGFCEDRIKDLKRDIWSNEYNLPPKWRDNGKPPLIDSEKYINSYQANVKGTEASIGATGMNDHMSNEELGELLEYGLAGENGFPARPHLRPWEAQVESKLPLLGKRIRDGLLGNR